MQYFFVMLFAGKNRSQDSVTSANKRFDLVILPGQRHSAKIQAGHMVNINRLNYEGKWKVAGSFGDDGNWKGIFIFDCKIKEEVEKILQTDPAVKSGRLA